MKDFLKLDSLRYPTRKAMPKQQYYFRKVQITPPIR